MQIALRVILPLLLALLVGVMLFSPSTLEKAGGSLQGVIAKSSENLAPTMLSWQDLEKERRYTSLEDALRRPEDVRILDLSGQQLYELPTDIGKLKNLQILSLQNNKLSYLPPELVQLPYLQYLHLRQNRLQRLPAGFGKWRYLLHLDLSANRFKEVPMELGGLTALRELDLRQNQLRNLPNEVGYLGHLKVLRVGYNNLTRLPESLTRIDSLNLVDLSHNHGIEWRPVLATLSKMPQLHTLELAQQKINRVPQDIANLRKLRILNLRGNALKTEEQTEVRSQLPNTEIEF